MTWQMWLAFFGAAIVIAAGSWLVWDQTRPRPEDTRIVPAE